MSVSRRAALALPALVPSLASAQSRPLRLLVGFPPGASLDFLARILAEGMSERLHRPVVVENRAGGGGRVAAEAVAHAPGDGDMLMVAPIVVPVFFPFVYPNLSFDPVKDLAPVARLTAFNFALTVKRDHPARDLAAFIAWAREKGDNATFGSLSAGTPSHFLGDLFNQATGCQLRHIPYRGSAPLMTALLAGEVDCGFPTTGSIVGRLQDGTLRALAITGDTRSPLLPEVPSFAELGPQLRQMGEAVLWYGMFAPGRTPPEVVATLAQAALATIAQPEATHRLTELDMPPLPMPPAAFAESIAADVRRWGPLIQASGFRLDN
ncbi:Bug family tripartite tricarboxylate transporter substrate binding protein [Rhodovarius lipocyclicus]|uniref:Bug family tripartite tricarboxylate transporter substrate binding protein n=1 Tax=Rhodovarius lipocyclicus TaxID=268410 RepID=UPI0013577F7B|nr:tripartite tricarboxylate transporter substrate binding protein [Rhodovarius lipocyclicus]